MDFVVFNDCVTLVGCVYITIEGLRVCRLRTGSNGNLYSTTCLYTVCVCLIIHIGSWYTVYGNKITQCNYDLYISYNLHETNNNNITQIANVHLFNEPVASAYVLSHKQKNKFVDLTSTKKMYIRAAHSKWHKKNNTQKNKSKLFCSMCTQNSVDIPHQLSSSHLLITNS